jgi:hypothetical protein
LILMVKLGFEVANCKLEERLTSMWLLRMTRVSIVCQIMDGFWEHILSSCFAWNLSWSISHLRRIL